eukprot:375728_1
MSNQTQKKRTRTVKNALVDIHSVSLQPGINYTNWITFCKHQLKERELNFLKLKINKIQFIVNDTCKVQNFAIKQEIIDITIKILWDKIDKWAGVNVNLTKSSLSVYANYFIIGKKWWDAQKRSIYGNIFWLNVFQSVQQFVKADVKLLLEIINVSFNSTFDIPNTKPCPLISGTTLIQSNQLHTYLYNKHHSLNITQWITDIDKCAQKTKTIIHKLKGALKTVTSQIIRTNDRNTSVIQPQYTNNNNTNPHINNMIFSNISVNNNSNHNITMNNPMVLPYGVLHNTTHRVSDARYTPLLSLPSVVQNVPLNWVGNNNQQVLNTSHMNVLPTNMNQWIFICFS